MATRAVFHYVMPGTPRASTERAHFIHFYYGLFPLILLVLFGIPAPSNAAEPNPDQITFYLLTMGEGAQVYERFGHNALLVESPEFSAAFNYGIFDFNQHNFILRFLAGRMYYRLEPWNKDETIAMYVGEDRSVWQEKLNLTPEQKMKLYRLLEAQLKARFIGAPEQYKDFQGTNPGPGTSYYRYDYYADNCSTRIRNALDQVLGGEMRAQLDGVPTSATYRWHTRRAMACDPAIYTALYYVMGQPVDRKISAWEECFLPLRMRQHFQRVMVSDSQGRRRPLLEPAAPLHQTRTFFVPAKPPTWWPWYLLWGILIGTALACGAWAGTRWRVARIGFVVLAILWLFVLAFAGWFLAGAWAITSHAAVYYNENLFHLSPLALPLVVLVPAMALRKQWARRWCTWLTCAVLASSALGLLAKALPSYYQVNWEIIALALPAHAGLAIAVWMMGRLPALARRAKPAPGEGGKERHELATGDDGAGSDSERHRMRRRRERAGEEG